MFTHVIIIISNQYVDNKNWYHQCTVSDINWVWLEIFHKRNFQSAIFRIGKVQSFTATRVPLRYLRTMLHNIIIILSHSYCVYTFKMFGHTLCTQHTFALPPSHVSYTSSEIYLNNYYSRHVTIITKTIS